MKWIDIHRHNTVQDPQTLTLVNLDKNFHLDQDMPDLDYFSVGIHPWWIKDLDIEHSLEKMQELSKHKNFFCFGEMGLDLAIELDINTQIDVFKKQLKLAKTYSPSCIVIHCVRAYNEVIGAVRRAHFQGQLIFHDFNASIEIAKQLISQGHLLSYGRHLFNEETKAYKLFSEIPLENIIFETDDSSQMVIEEVYKQASKLKKIDINVLKESMQLKFDKILATRKN